MTITLDYDVDLTSADDPEAWRAEAHCAQTDPEAFFPEKGGSTRPAKSVCRSGCPVRAECLAYALAHDERFGIWGGYSERERRRIKHGIEQGLPFPDLTPRPGIVVEDGPGGHGRAKYVAGCRCDVCKEKNAEYMRLYTAAVRPARVCESCGGEVHGRGRRRFCQACHPSRAGVAS